MKTEQILSLLKEEKQEQAQKFAAYCVRLFKEQKGGVPKNPWMQTKTPEQLAQLFKRVAAEGIVFDGVHVTLQSTGVNYDYVAYKNKMLVAYPESEIDIQVVYEGDEFSCYKQNGLVFYNHTIKDPFNGKDEDIKGTYCVIKNKRGNFITSMGRDEISKHRRVAKTDYIWAQWFKEMCMKTVMKKACKLHFNDIYTTIEDMDNENTDVEKEVKPTELENYKAQIVEVLNNYQGEDKNDIQKLCQDKSIAGEFDMDFAKNILKQVSYGK